MNQYHVGVVLAPAALKRIRWIADAAEDPDLRVGPPGSEDEILAALGDQWVEVARNVQLITKDTGHTHQVLTDAVNRAACAARGASHDTR